MLIEVRGIASGNMGAQLMLTAIVRHYAEDKLGVRLAVDHSVGSYERRARLGLYQKVWFSRLGGLSNVVAGLVPGKLRRIYGLVTEGDIDAVLDASGFTYTDQWGPDKCERVANLTAEWKRRGKKIILLPQAFGPFENPRTKAAFARILSQVDLVYARDPISYEHVTNVGGEDPRVKLAPDFTNLVEGTLPSYFKPKPRLGCIVPNSRMIDKCEGEVAGSYPAFLVSCIRLLAERDIEPFILLHETGDRALAKRVQSECGHEIEIVAETDPVNLKGILGASHVVIGSRFHGLVGALSQGVPSLATGWSHKYQTLLADYGCPELLISPLAPREELAAKLDMIVDGSSREAIARKLTETSLMLKEKAKRMWAEVDGLFKL